MKSTSSSSSSSPPGPANRCFLRPQSYAWIILFFGALNVIFLGGKRRAFGIFIADFHQREFRNVSLAELNWIGDSYAAFGYMTTSLSTALILRYGRRYRISQFLGSCFVLAACLTSATVQSAHALFFTHTVLHGLGSSLILSTVGLVVNEHFDKQHRYHILATTLVSGGSVASIVFVQFYAHLIETHGWRQAFVILGIIYFCVNASAALIFVRTTDSATAPGSVASSNSVSGGGGGQSSQTGCCRLSGEMQAQITRKHVPLLALWTVDRAATSIITYGLLLNLADFSMRSRGSLSKSTGLTVMFAGGEAATYLAGAILAALARDSLRHRLKYVLLASTGLLSLSLLLWEFLQAWEGLSLLMAAVSGLCLGPSICFLFPAGEEMTLLPGSLAYPLSLGGMGLGMLLSPTLSAVIATAFRYRGFFLVQAAIASVKFSALFFLCILSTRLSTQLTGPHYHRLASHVDDDNDDRHVDDDNNNLDIDLERDSPDVMYNSHKQNIKIRVR